MPPWLSYVLLGVAVIVIAYLVYRVIHNQRWYYLFAFTAFVTSFFSAPALKLVVKASGLDKKWNFDVDATWNENSWMINVAAMMVITYFFILENNYQKGLSHEKYFHEFQVVVLDNLRDGIEAKDIAKNRKILLEKVEAIICCMAWLETKPHKKKP